MDETRVIYHIDDEETPYLVKIPISSDKVTLADFKNVLNRPNYKYFFKSMDDDFGVVKEEIVDDSAHLPCFNGRVISWLVSADGSNQSDGGSQCAELPHGGVGRAPTLGSPPPPLGLRPAANLDTDTESVASALPPHPHRQQRLSARYRQNGHHQQPGLGSLYDTSSDIETTSFISNSTTALTSDYTTSTNNAGGPRQLQVRKRAPQTRRTRRLKPPTHMSNAAGPLMSRTSSYSSITDSTMSLNIITVSLNMDTVNFLGISIVGQSNKGGDGGIYVGSIMKGGAVALDGRIEPGDMILQVNDVNFENMTNDEAVRVLREVVQKPGPIKLVVAKCWNPNPKSYFTIPRTEPVRPIDPGAWVAHTTALRHDLLTRPVSTTTLSSSTSLANTLPASNLAMSEGAELASKQNSGHLPSRVSPKMGDQGSGVGGPSYKNGPQLTIASDMGQIVREMAKPENGLEIRDRLWLKITIPNSFIGGDVVDWLLSNVQGFQERRDARKFASLLLKSGLIRHTVNKINFSEQCYYVFGDLDSQFEELSLEESREVSASSNYMPYSGIYNPLEYQPMPFYTANDDTVYGYNKSESSSEKNSSESELAGSKKRNFLEFFPANADALDNANGSSSSNGEVSRSSESDGSSSQIGAGPPPPPPNAADHISLKMKAPLAKVP